jgi:hypothetical protein
VEVLKENCPDVTRNPGVFRTCFNGEIKALRLLENRGLFKITDEGSIGIAGRFLPRGEKAEEEGLVRRGYASIAEPSFRVFEEEERDIRD